MNEAAQPAGQDERAVVPPERFCIGVHDREQCDDCAGRYVADEGFSVPLRILVHQPWPFEPCPHFVSDI
jgi:hypothetical protein